MTGTPAVGIDWSYLLPSEFDPVVTGPVTTHRGAGRQPDPGGCWRLIRTGTAPAIPSHGPRVPRPASFEWEASDRWNPGTAKPRAVMSLSRSVSTLPGEATAHPGSGYCAYHGGNLPDPLQRDLEQRRRAYRRLRGREVKSYRRYIRAHGRGPHSGARAS